MKIDGIDNTMKETNGEKVREGEIKEEKRQGGETNVRHTLYI